MEQHLMNPVRRTVLLWMAVILAAPAGLADPPDEFRVRRADVFAFTQKPAITRKGDEVEIRFAVKEPCDVTVAVQNEDGTIVRHLASGVLGENAPAPFEKNALRQTLVWDGKNDQGVYLDDVEGLTVRVSLGLTPRFERTLFWAPKRRPSRDTPLFAAAEEGVYVYNGGTSIDSIILYDRDGNYVRTVYPFPGDEIGETRGLQWRRFPQDGRRLPLKTNFLRCTMLTSGTNAGTSYHDHRDKPAVPPLAHLTEHFAMYGRAAQAMAVRDGRIALAYLYLNRLGTDGTTGGLPLLGPKLTLPYKRRRGKPQLVSPHSAALSPDGKTLYLTAYHFGRIQRATQDIAKLVDVRTIPVVMRLNMQTDEEPKVFKGHTTIEQAGSDNEHFKVPTGVAVDAKGRVYVSDYMNDRIQVFSAAGRHLQTIPARRPAHVAIHRKTGDIYVFSWRVRNQYEQKAVLRQVVVHGPFEDPKKKAAVPLAAQGRFSAGWGQMTPVEFTAAIDSWSDPVRIWIAEPWAGQNVLNRGRIRHSGIQIKEMAGDKLKTVRDFAVDCQKQRVPLRAPIYYRQRLYVNPATGKLYVAEGNDNANGKAFNRLFEIDPETGRHKTVQIPYDTEDMCFDLEGLAYLRTVNVVGRFNPSGGWREVPWDYGEERTRVAFGWMSGTRTAHLQSAIVMPSDGNWHHGGIHVSARRHMVVACGYNVSMQVRTKAKYVHRGKKYTPKVFPGRLMGGRCGATCVHVWDRHGKLIGEDVTPGQCDLYGIGIDEHDNLYMMSSAPRMMPGKPPTPYPDRTAGTLMKFPAGSGRILSLGKGVRIPLPDSQRPDRPVDFFGGPQGRAWLVDAEWAYGGVGYSGGNIGGCSCWNARFALDSFARSFAPEVTRYSVAVLDSAGNVILRLGRYGNVDDGRPMDPKGGPPDPRSIGGDEIALFHGPYLATHTDHRLFIADPGNGRILGVKLGYGAEATVPLRGLADRTAADEPR
jgi:hypothetical protein